MPKSGKRFGRGERIRTFDILVPNQARYRAALHPEKRAFYRCEPGRSINLWCGRQIRANSLGGDENAAIEATCGPPLFRL